MALITFSYSVFVFPSSCALFKGAKLIINFPMGIILKPGPNSQPVTVQMRIWILTKTSVFDLTQQVHFACIFGFVKFMSFDLQEKHHAQNGEQTF